MTELQSILQEDGARIIDVRTPYEFAGGHVASSENIPLNEIPERIQEVMNSRGPVIFCCASGMRSDQATRFLQDQGVNRVYNGGSWMDVNYLLSK